MQMSGSEVFIYGYGAVCLSMIVFNIIYNIMLRKKEPETTMKARSIKQALVKKYETACSEEDTKQWEITKVRVFLKEQALELDKSDDLLTLSEAVSLLDDEDLKAVSEGFIKGLQPLLPSLAENYLKKDKMQMAYFAVFLQKFRRRSKYDDVLLDCLLKYAAQKNMYCRINALDALYAFGNAKYVEKAVEIQDGMDAFLHEKVLTEGLLSFSGNHEELIKAFIGRFEEFTVKTKHAILNYIRFKSGGYKEFMYQILIDEKEDRELRLSAIRYFGRYPWNRARSMLINFAMDKDRLRWEYAAVAAAALKDYEGEDVISALKSALYSSNWYVRYNAAVSLEASGLSYSKLIDVMAGNDRYAREMMEYRLEERRLTEENGLQ